MNAGLSLLGAFGAGVLSFFTPCCLPMVPVYLTYLAGEESDRRSRETWFLVRQAALFALGFTLVFVALGASATAAGQLLLSHRLAVRRVAGIALTVFGLHLAGLLPLRFLEQTWMAVGAVPSRLTRGGALRPLLLGVAFSAGWQPCIGPVLGGILALASAQGSVRAGVVLLLTYSLGLALPYLAAAAFLGRFRERLPGLMESAARIRRASGYLLIVMGVLVFFNLFGRLSGWVPVWLPL